MRGSTRKWRWALALVAAAGMAATACDEQVESESLQEAGGGLVSADTPGAQALNESDGPVTSRSVVRDVDDGDAEQISAIGEGVVDPALAEEIEAVELPVLLPDDAELVEALFFVGADNFYTATVHVDDEVGEQDHMIVIQGSRMVEEAPGHGEMRHELGDGYHITRIHKIPTLKMERFGISYQVHVECNRPHENRRCTEDDYIESIADSLKIAGGQ